MCALVHGARIRRTVFSPRLLPVLSRTEQPGYPSGPRQNGFGAIPSSWFACMAARQKPRVPCKYRAASARPARQTAAASRTAARKGCAFWRCPATPPRSQSGTRGRQQSPSGLPAAASFAQGLSGETIYFGVARLLIAVTSARSIRMNMRRIASLHVVVTCPRKVTIALVYPAFSPVQ